jgi:hypothetical protein
MSSKELDLLGSVGQKRKYQRHKDLAFTFYQDYVALSFIRFGGLRYFQERYTQAIFLLSLDDILGPTIQRKLVAHINYYAQL